jgi:hypothetical protein
VFSPDHAGTLRKADYRIAGHASAWICDRCVRLAQVRYLALVTALPLTAFLAAYQVPGAESVCAAAGSLLLVALPVLTFAARKEFGERVAIRARKKELSAQAYRAFPSADAFKRMDLS